MHYKILMALSSATLTAAMLGSPVLANTAVPATSQAPVSDNTQSLTPQSIHIGVIGEVQAPGAYFLSDEVATDEDSVLQQLPTVTRAIQAAGGITPMADVRQVQVRRQAPDGTTQTIELNLYEYLSQNDLSQDVRLQEGDVVVVPFAP